MNRTKKIIVLISMLALMLLALTACGSKNLVATKTTDVMGVTYTERVEVSFKSNKTEQVLWTLEFDSESFAERYASVFESQNSDNGFEVKQDGKKVILTLDADSFAKLNGGSNKDSSRKAMKASLEASGYTVED